MTPFPHPHSAQILIPLRREELLGYCLQWQLDMTVQMYRPGPQLESVDKRPGRQLGLLWWLWRFGSIISCQCLLLLVCAGIIIFSYQWSSHKLTVSWPDTTAPGNNSRIITHTLDIIQDTLYRSHAQPYMRHWLHNMVNGHELMWARPDAIINERKQQTQDPDPVCTVNHQIAYT